MSREALLSGGIGTAVARRSRERDDGHMKTQATSVASWPVRWYDEHEFDHLGSG
jgi:hypothetical protein